MGSTEWEVAAGQGIITRAGHIRFRVQYIQATVVMSQSLDTRKQPRIKDLQLELGNIQVKFGFDIFFVFFCLEIPKSIDFVICSFLGSKRRRWNIRLCC